MEKISKLEVAWNGLLLTLVKRIKDWNPPKLRAETEYRDHLAKLLRQAVPRDARVEREFRHRGTTIDIHLLWKGIAGSDEIAFELKKDLHKKGDFDRLVGQIEGLEPGKNKIVVVLIGNTDEALLRRLEEKYAKYISGGLTILDTQTLAIIPVHPPG